MKTIFIDISQFLHNRLQTGIQRVIKEFLLLLLKDTRFSTSVVYFSDSIDQCYLLEKKEVENFLKDVQNYSLPKKKKIDFLSQTSQNKIFFDIDSVWNSSIHRESLYPILKQHGYKIYNFIYDLTPILFQNYAKEDTALNFETFLKTTVKYSDKVFFTSKSAKNDFINFINKNTLNRTIDLDVVYLGSNINKNNKSIYGRYKHILQSKYILFVGTIEPRKQHPLLLKAFEHIYSEHKDINLVLIGKKGWKTEQFMTYLTSHRLYEKSLFHLENISDNELEYFYKNALLVTYLSYYEGFGLPLAESLSYGNVTITSKNSSLVEVGKEFADFVDTEDLNGLINTIKNYLDNPKLYKEKKEHIQSKYLPRTWEDFYKDIAQLI